MSPSLSPRPEPAVLPSLPPSPSLLEEVFSHPRPWSVRHEEFDLPGLRRASSSGSPSSRAKGKEKRALKDDEDDEEDEDAQHRASTHEAYPPMTDEAAETRRVEETLERWEFAERQRRKSVRESTRYTASPSLLTSVTRTASLVLSGRTAPISPGGARAFKSHEIVDVAREGYAVPLDDIDQSRGSSGDVVVHSPSLSTIDRSTSLDAGTGTGTRTASSSGTSEDPFVHPSERTPTLTPVTPTPTLLPPTPSSPSPFSDARAQQALHTDLTIRVGAENKTLAHKRSSRSGAPFVPPPRPLDLPSPHATPFQPTSQPVLRTLRREDPEERQEVRWWHDWLCGCGEGPDRGGDNQAGRTNPFE